MATPIFRFKGFTGDWEQRKFSEFTWMAGTRNKENLDLEPYSITNVDGFVKQSEAHDEFGYMKNTDRSAYNIVKSNSFAYNPARINVGSIGYYDGADDVIVSSLYEVFKTADYVDDGFLWQWFMSEEFPKWIEKLQEGSVRQYFYYDKLSECQMHMPSIEEQRRIATALYKLDNLITLHQRKCDALKDLKKGMLQKMFPREGFLVPEFRFKGFTGDWEKRKLGEITTKIGSGKTPRGGSEAYVDDGIPLIRSQNVHDDLVDLSDVVYIDEETNKSMENSLVECNDVLLNITGASIGRSAVYKGSESVNVNQHVCIIRPTEDYSSDFIQMNLASNNGQKQIDSSQAGGAREGLNFQQIGKMEFAFPSIDEQKRIGTYFSNLNNLITLHQRKCDALKDLKKGMLQKMFV